LKRPIKAQKKIEAQKKQKVALKQTTYGAKSTKKPFIFLPAE
jgi:hypothetical protein